MDDKKAFYVQNSDGRKFKLLIRGNLGKLSVGKIRRYLKSYGVPEDHVLVHNGMVLEDSDVGDTFGLQNNAVLRLISPRRDKAGMDAWGRNAADSSSQPARNEGAGAATRTPTAALTNHVDPENIPGVCPMTSSGSVSALPNNNNNNRNSEGSSGNTNAGVGPSVALEVENQQLREEVRRLRQELLESQEGSKQRVSISRQNPASIDLLQNAKANLLELGEELGVLLQFDMNLTCVVGTDENLTVLVTLDQATERLYVYSTLLTQLPEEVAVRVRLYELLLEGSLLGREVCGGGIGASFQNSIVLLSTSIPLRHCSSSALKDIMPSFVETLARWRSLINELLE